MEDITKREYASWLEEVVKDIAEKNPKRICFAMEMDDGGALTAYWNCDPFTKAAIATHIQSDAFIQMALCNADRIVQKGEEMLKEEGQEE